MKSKTELSFFRESTFPTESSKPPAGVHKAPRQLLEIISPAIQAPPNPSQPLPNSHTQPPLSNLHHGLTLNLDLDHCHHRDL